jgi:photosystem II stability/assembly factor-like uncharacterized protein
MYWGGAPAAAPWTLIAPPGATVGQIAVEPRTGQLVAATSASGLYRSGDHGATWTPASRGFGIRPVERLLAAPGAFYALSTNRLFRSTDGGASWTSLPEPQYVFDFALAPGVPNVVYAAAFRKALRSDDGGATFRPVGSIADLGVYDLGPLAVDPNDIDVVYGRSNLGLVTSRDGGAHWTVVGPLPDALVHPRLTVDPADSSTLYLDGDGKLFRSSDRGGHWREIDSSFPHGAQVSALAGAAGPLPRLYAAVRVAGASTVDAASGLLFASDDQGEHWRQLLATAEVLALAVDPAQPARVYAGTAGLGVLASPDAGAHWARGTGLRDLPVDDLAADPRAAGVLYLVSDLGLQKSTDRGRTWATLATDGAVEVSPASRVALDPKTRDAVYLTAFDAADAHRLSLFASDDGGASWAARGVLPAGITVERLAVDPQSPRHLIAAGSRPIEVCYGFGLGCEIAPHFAAWSSRDGGVHWAASAVAQLPADGQGTLRGVVFDPVDSRRVFLVGDRCLRSTDRGVTWSPLAADETLALKDLAIDPVHAGVFYGASTRLLKSTDGGRHWLPVAALLDPVERVAVDPRSGVVYAATTARGVWSSRDGGAHWTPVGSSGLPGLPANRLVVDPFRAGHLWVGLPGLGGLYSSPL